MAGMDSNHGFSGGRDSRGSRFRLKSDNDSKTLDNEMTQSAELGSRATNGKAAVGARTTIPMTIVNMVLPSMHQAFLREFQMLADGGEGTAEGSVVPTADGLVILRTKDEWVTHMFDSHDDVTTDRYKMYKQLKEQILALSEAANSDISLLKLAHETAY
jgi:hypothetical protein